MLGWIGIDQSMKMNESSRVLDKKLTDNNYRASTGIKAVRKKLQCESYTYRTCDKIVITDKDGSESLIRLFYLLI